MIDPDPSILDEYLEDPHNIVRGTPKDLFLSLAFKDLTIFYERELSAARDISKEKYKLKIQGDLNTSRLYFTKSENRLKNFSSELEKTRSGCEEHIKNKLLELTVKKGKKTQIKNDLSNFGKTERTSTYAHETHRLEQILVYLLGQTASEQVLTNLNLTQNEFDLILSALGKEKLQRIETLKKKLKDLYFSQKDLKILLVLESKEIEKEINIFKNDFDSLEAELEIIKQKIEDFDQEESAHHNDLERAHKMIEKNENALKVLESQENPNWISEEVRRKQYNFQILKTIYNEGKGYWATELRKRKDFAQENDITHLVHFTQEKNLDSILEFNLSSNVRLRNLGVNYESSDLQRFDRLPDYICTSISFPNYKMFYLKKKNNEKWVVLKLKPSVLWEYPCIFSPSNAASSSFINQSHKLDDLFDELGQTRQTLQLPNHFTTDPQAEVLVYNSINKQDILSIASEEESLNKRIAEKYKNLGISFVCEENLFLPRIDYEFWRNKKSFYSLKSNT